MHLWQNDILEGVSSSLFILTQELAELSTPVIPETVEMTTVGEGKGMGLSTRYSYYFFILKCHNFGWEWLVWLAVSILEKVLGVIKPKLSIGSFSPSKN